MAWPYNSDPERPFQAVETIPLAAAILCANCECITPAKNGHCLVCGSKSVISLSVALNRACDDRSTGTVWPLFPVLIGEEKNVEE
jgi:hypothetical protein